MQLYSVEQQRSQALDAHAAAFGLLKVAGNAEASQLVSFAKRVLVNGVVESKLHIIELGAKPGAQPFTKRAVDFVLPPDYADDFPISMQVGAKYGLVYLITKMGLLYVFDLETGAAVYRNRISAEPIFLTAEAAASGGFYAINRAGQVLQVDVNPPALVPFVTGTLQNMELALALARRGGLPGAEALLLPRFQQLIAAGDYKAAAEIAADAPGLRTRETVARFASAPAAAGATSPLLTYFGTCLQRGKLNALESVELARLVVSQNKKALLDTWMAEEKLECSEELGDVVYAADQEMGLKVYVKARADVKVVTAFAALGDMDKIASYCTLTGYKPDYTYLLMRIVTVNPGAAVKLAIAVSKMGLPTLDVNMLADLFLQRNMVQEATAFLLEVLKGNLPEQAALQTKVLEVNLVAFPKVADAILANGMFSHYDKPRVAQLCESAGLYARALAHYTQLPDIKRVMSNAAAIDPVALVEFFGTLSSDWALDCLRELMAVNARANLQLVVQVAKEYTEQLSTEKIIELLESFKSYDGLFYYLGAHVARSEDPDVHFKYIEACARTNQLEEAERMTRESNFFDAERAKVFLMDAKLSDARPLINVCDRFGFVHGALLAPMPPLPCRAHSRHSRALLRQI